MFFHIMVREGDVRELNLNDTQYKTIDGLSSNYISNLLFSL